MDRNRPTNPKPPKPAKNKPIPRTDNSGAGGTAKKRHNKPHSVLAEKTESRMTAFINTSEDEEEDDDDDEDYENVGIFNNPSGSVLVPAVNRYDKAERIRQANTELFNTPDPPVCSRRPRVRFNERLTSFRSDDYFPDGEQSSGPFRDPSDILGHLSQGMEGVVGSKLVVTLPCPQDSEDGSPRDSEDDEKSDDNNYRQSVGSGINEDNFTIKSMEEELIEEIISSGSEEEVEEQLLNRQESCTNSDIYDLSNKLEKCVSLESNVNTMAYEVNGGSNFIPNESNISSSILLPEIKNNKTDLEMKNNDGTPCFNNSMKNESYIQVYNNLNECPLQIESSKLTNKLLIKLPSCSGPLKKDYLKLNNQNSCPKHSKTASLNNDDRPHTAPAKKYCCSSKKSELLPHYNGFNSEYGLSAAQLQDRKRNMVKKSKILKLRRHQKNMEEERRRYENDLIFSSWLAKKRKESNEKLIACTKIEKKKFCIKTEIAPSSHLLKTGAVRTPELRASLMDHPFYSRQQSNQSKQQQKTYRIYLSVLVE